MIRNWIRGLGLVALAGLAGCAPAGNGGNGNDNTPSNGNGNDNSNGGVPTWQSVIDVTSASLLAVSGTSPTDVYVVGSDDGQGSIFLHYDGTDWARLDAGTTDALWWISAAPVDGLFFLSGDNGQIVRFNPDSGQTTLMTTPSDTLRVFGTWGATATDMWAAISDVGIGSNSGQIWHYDGNAENEWVNVDLSAINGGAGIPGLIKIWGRSADDVYAVGAAGTALHFDGTSWSEIESGTTRTLFSVHGNGEHVGACGGFADGVIVELADSAFEAVPPIPVQMNGIFFEPGTDFAVAIGVQEQIAFRESGTWTIRSDTGLSDFSKNFHGPWIDQDGGVWATGGILDTQPMTGGILVYYGEQQLPTADF